MRALLPPLFFSLTLAAAAGAQAASPVTPAATPPLETPATAPSDTGGDPIGDILGALPPDQTTDEDADTRATAATPAAAAPAAIPPASTVAGAPFATPPAMTIAPTPIPPPSAAPRRPALDRPVMIGEAGVTPDGPPTTSDLIYESRIRASASSAQGLQGSLDGGWTVRGPDGAPLMALQLVDRGGYGPLEGAWRSLPAGKVGLIDTLDRQPSVLTVRISRGYGKPQTVLSLTPTGAGWVGQITDETGSRAVTMVRN